MSQPFIENNHLPELTVRALSLMREHFAELYGVEELAQQLGVTKSHLVRSFSDAVGITPGCYLTKVRIAAAKSLLLYRDYPLESVAGLCGFSSANYLCRVFKKETGMPPGAWRQRYADVPPATPSQDWEGQFYV